MYQKLATDLLANSYQSSRSSKWEEAVVDGISMWPALKPGYRVRYRAINPDLLDAGDIIVVQGHGKKGEPLLRVHRLVGRTGPLFLEAGDNTFAASLVPAERILGRVEKIRDERGRPAALATWRAEKSRFRYHLLGANLFLFTHELKDRFLGTRRSRLLWQASQLYRAGLGTFGLDVPTLLPR